MNDFIVAVTACVIVGFWAVAGLTACLVALAGYHRFRHALQIRMHDSIYNTLGWSDYEAAKDYIQESIDSRISSLDMVSTSYQHALEEGAAIANKVILRGLMAELKFRPIIKVEKKPAVSLDTLKAELVRAKRWEIGFRRVVTYLVGPREDFEINEITDLVRDLAGCDGNGDPMEHGNRRFVRRESFCETTIRLERQANDIAKYKISIEDAQRDIADHKVALVAAHDFGIKAERIIVFIGNGQIVFRESEWFWWNHARTKEHGPYTTARFAYDALWVEVGHLWSQGNPKP